MAHNIQVGPEVGPTFGPTWRLAHLRGDDRAAERHQVHANRRAAVHLGIRSHCRFRKKGTESFSTSGITCLNGATKRQGDRALHPPHAPRPPRPPRAPARRPGPASAAGDEFISAPPCIFMSQRFSIENMQARARMPPPSPRLAWVRLPSTSSCSGSVRGSIESAERSQSVTSASWPTARRPARAP